MNLPACPPGSRRSVRRGSGSWRSVARRASRTRQIDSLAQSFLRDTKEVIDEVGGLKGLPPEAIAEIKQYTERDMRLALWDKRKLPDS